MKELTKDKLKMSAVAVFGVALGTGIGLTITPTISEYLNEPEPITDKQNLGEFASCLSIVGDNVRAKMLDDDSFYQDGALIFSEVSLELNDKPVTIYLTEEFAIGNNITQLEFNNMEVSEVDAFQDIVNVCNRDTHYSFY